MNFELLGVLQVFMYVDLGETEKRVALVTHRGVLRENCEDLVEQFLTLNRGLNRRQVWAHWSCADHIHINRGPQE